MDHLQDGSLKFAWHKTSFTAPKADCYLPFSSRLQVVQSGAYVLFKLTLYVKKDADKFHGIEIRRLYAPRHFCAAGIGLQNELVQVVGFKRLDKVRFDSHLAERHGIGNH